MKQITLIAKDEVGVLADISYILGKARINIESISVASLEGKAIITMFVKDGKRAKKLLKSNNYKVLESEAFVLKLKDEPGQLSNISRMLSKKGVSIANLYVIAREKGSTIMSIKVDKPKAAKKVLAPYLDIED